MELMNKFYRVLLVEDDPLVQFIHRTMLEELGCEVFVASNAMEAINLATSKYDFIFLDIGLPDINGIELASMLRLMFQHPTRLIALTAYTDNSTKEKCFSAGIEAIFHKPISSDLLRKIIKNIK
jgi:CheY-like chemotaxis protein